MRSCRLFTLLLLVAALAGSAPAEAAQAPKGFPEIPLRDLLVRRWTLDDGLPTETLTGVLQTRDGFLWITSYEGLFRFDGRRFEVFDKQRITARRAPGSEVEIVADGFPDLAEDRSGALWIAGQGGQVLRYQDGWFSVFNTPVEGPVHDLCIDGSDRLRIGGRSSADIDLRREDLIPVAIPELQEIAIETVLCDREVWFGTNEGSLFQLRDDGSLAGSPVLAGDGIESLAASRDGSLWVGSRDGLSRTPPEGDKRGVADREITSFPEFRGIGIYEILEDRGGDLWMATSRGLGRRRANGAVEWLDSSESGLGEAHALHFDHEGSLWVAGRRDGLFRFVERKLASLSARDGLRPGAVDALLEMRSGEILIGFDEYLAIVDEQMRPTPRALPPDLDRFDVLVLLEDRSGDLWIGSYLGLLRIYGDGRGEGFQLYTKEKGFPSSQIRALHQDPQGSIWIGTGNRGVLKMSLDGSMEILDQASGLVSDFVFSIDEDQDGDLLFGMRGGLHILSQGGELSTYRAGRDFPGSSVFSVFADGEGRLWLSTDGGLVRFDGENFRALGRGQGLPIDVIFDVQEDDLGWIWISSTKGVIRGSKDALNSFFDGDPTAVEFDLFDEEDGMSNRQCTGARRILKTSDGRLWFPTHDGVTIADPRRLAFNEHVPPVVVDRFLVDGEEIAAGRQISLAPGPSRYEFEFAVLSLRDPAKNRARYMLEGFDEGWQEAGAKRGISYTSLPHGRYVFRVIGSNDDGLWNDTGARIAFEVKPFYYETPIFRVAAVLFFVLMVAGIYRWRHRAIRRRNRELQELSEQRRQLIVALQERNEEIDRYLYIFSHDFKNPLLTIRNFASLIRVDMDEGAPDRARVDIDRITGAADQMNRQLDDLLRFAEIRRTRTTQESFFFAQIVRAAAGRWAAEIARRGVELAVFREAPGAETLEIFGDRERLIEVVEELLKNALKFLSDSSQPRIEIGARREGPSALCWVRDSGIGIASIYHEKVFRPLEQLDPQQEGTGIGLALVSRVIEQHGGRVWIESEGEGRGTAVWFTLPLRNAEDGA